MHRSSSRHRSAACRNHVTRSSIRRPCRALSVVWHAMDEGQGERRTGSRAALDLLRRNRDFRRLFLASVISLGGDWFLFLALGGLVLEATGKAAAVGIMICAQEVPIFLATPWAGWLADRLSHPRLGNVCHPARRINCGALLLRH